MGKLEKFELFYTLFIPRRYKKGEVIIRADDTPKGFFCLTKGYIRQYTVSRSGNELTLRILQPISYFPMIWAIHNAPNTYFFEALTSVEAGRAPRAKMINYIKDKPDITLTLMSNFLADYEETLARMEHLAFSDAYRRVISALLYIAKHFGQKEGRHIVIHYRFTHQNIAALVGLARETTSIEMEKIEKKKLIEYVNHSILIKNLKKIKAEIFM